MQFFRRPELEQGQTHLAQTACILLRGFCSHGLPYGHLEAPALGRRSRALKWQRTIGALYFQGMSVTLLNGLAKEEEG